MKRGPLSHALPPRSHVFSEPPVPNPLQINRSGERQHFSIAPTFDIIAADTYRKTRLRLIRSFLSCGLYSEPQCYSHHAFLYCPPVTLFVPLFRHAKNTRRFGVPIIFGDAYTCDEEFLRRVLLHIGDPSGGGVGGEGECRRSTRLHRLHAADKPSPADAIRGRLLEQNTHNVGSERFCRMAYWFRALLVQTRLKRSTSNFFSALVVRHRQQNRHIPNPERQSLAHSSIHCAIKNVSQAAVPAKRGSYLPSAPISTRCIDLR